MPAAYDTCPGADVFAAGPTWSIFATLRWAETCFTAAFFAFAAQLPRQPSTYPLSQASGPGHGSLCDTRCTAAFATGFVCLILSRGFAGQAVRSVWTDETVGCLSSALAD